MVYRQGLLIHRRETGKRTRGHHNPGFEFKSLGTVVAPKMKSETQKKTLFVKIPLIWGIFIMNTFVVQLIYLDPTLFQKRFKGRLHK